MRSLRLRIAVVPLLLLAGLAAPRALATSLGHSALVPLPSVLPPTPLARPMSWAHGTSAAPAAAFRGGRAVVGVSAGVDGRALAGSLGLHVVEWLPGLRLVEVAARPARLAALAGDRDPRIRYLEPVVAGHVAHVRNDPLTWEVDPSTGAPYEWQFHAVGVDQALNLAKGSASMLVGVVDSGISPVPDLTGKIAETFWDKTVNRSAADVLGHGTFVSSLIASRNDDGFGLAGFCGACRLAVYKAAPLTDVQVAEGIRTLTDAHVRVINLSIVLDNPSQAVTDALTYAANAGVLVVAASGNDDAQTVDYPASAVQQPNGAASPGLAVGASDPNGTRASFSNSGAQLSLLAPGTFNSSCTVGILGAIPAVATDFEESGSCAVIITHAGGARYAYAGGTSFAAPEVSGVAALVWSVKPSLTSTQVAGILEQTATRPAGTGWNSTTGWGVLNAKAAVENVTGRSSADSIVLAGLQISRPRAAGGRIRATVKARWADGSPILIGARPACRISIRGRAIHTSTSFQDRLGDVLVHAPSPHRRDDRRRQGRRLGRGRARDLGKLPVRDRRQAALERQCRTTVSPTAIVPELRRSALRPPRCTSSLMIPGRVSDSRCLQGSQSSTPSTSTSPTREPLADEGVQPHPADDDLPARGGRAQTDVFEHLGLDQGERAPGPLPGRVVMPVALEAVALDGVDRFDGAQRVRLADRDRVDLHDTRLTVSAVSSAIEPSRRSASAAASPGGKRSFGSRCTPCPPPSPSGCRCGSPRPRRRRPDRPPGGGRPRGRRRARACRGPPPRTRRSPGRAGRAHRAASTASISSRLEDEARPSVKAAAIRCTASRAPGIHGGPSA